MDVFAKWEEGTEALGGGRFTGQISPKVTDCLEQGEPSSKTLGRR